MVAIETIYNPAAAINSSPSAYIHQYWPYRFVLISPVLSVSQQARFLVSAVCSLHTTTTEQQLKKQFEKVKCICIRLISGHLEALITESANNCTHTVNGFIRYNKIVKVQSMMKSYQPQCLCVNYRDKHLFLSNLRNCSRKSRDKNCLNH